MEINAIKTEADHIAALKDIELLMMAEAGTEEGERLDVLATLVEAFENKHHAIGLPDPIEAIKFEMEHRGLGPKDLEPMIGKSNRVSEILNYKRPLTLRMIRNLHDGLGVPAEALIRKPEIHA